MKRNLLRVLAFALVLVFAAGLAPAALADQDVRIRDTAYSESLGLRVQMTGNAANTADCVICGVLTDEWRIARYMHASHVSRENGEFFRYAGNTVFPNGYIDMTLACPAGSSKLLVYGDTSETDSFQISIDGGEKITARFNSSGVAEFDLSAVKDKVQLRLSKAPGVFYPRFRAVAVK